MRLVVLSLLALGMLILGCCGFFQTPAQNQTNSTNYTNVTVVKDPVFSILSPTEGGIIYTQGNATDITLSITTQNLVLKQPGGTGNTGEGHFMVSVDGNAPLTVTSKNYVIPGLGLGDHTLKVELWTNDQKPYGISREVAFTVQQEVPLPYQPQNYTVQINDFSYDPASITVNAGDMVTFSNVGRYPRSATCFINGKQVFDTGVLGPGQSATLTMDKPLSCQYYSVIDEMVRGNITVQSG